MDRAYVNCITIESVHIMIASILHHMIRLAPLESQGEHLGKQTKLEPQTRDNGWFPKSH